jgi:hypothetical protein
MKKILLSTIIVFMTMTCIAQSQLEKNENSINNTLAVTYRLFATQNMWNFIKLNTRSGQMWQVQFDVEENNRFETNLNIIPLVEKEKQIDGRFTLYSTKNTWTFILLDQIEGKMWQVQWSIEPENRVVIPIE